MKPLVIAVAVLGLGSLVEAAPCKRARVTIQRVDDESPLLATMGRFVSKDKAAADADIVTEQEGWRSHDHMFYSSYLAANDRAKLERYLAELVKRPGFALAKDHALEIEKLVTPEGARFRTHYVTSTVLVDDRDFASAAVSTELSTVAGVVITLTAGGKTKFAAATKANVEHKLAVIVDGTVVSAPIIDSEVPGGKLVITTAAATDQEHAAEAKRLADALGCKP
ncbi:MAG: hypothetical protein NT062_20530 [Proteobacteria bacterium]|nr:hypothetical protein [Pseudomonadota bacterium]